MRPEAEARSRGGADLNSTPLGLLPMPRNLQDVERSRCKWVRAATALTCRLAGPTRWSRVPARFPSVHVAHDARHLEAVFPDEGDEVESADC